MRRWTLVLALLPLIPLMAAPERPAGEPLLLNSANFDPAMLLPPPPPLGSLASREELEQLHAIDARRTPAEARQAQDEGSVKDVTIYAQLLGPRFDLARLPATRALFATLRREEKAAADAGKAHFRRDRPWTADAALHSCSTKDAPGSSYPSGHSSMAYSTAAILARLVPSQAEAIMLRAQHYARSRLICEVHWPSDVIAGQAYGMLIAERLMEQPAFRARFAAASAEMHAAGFR